MTLVEAVVVMVIIEIIAAVGAVIATSTAREARSHNQQQLLVQAATTLQMHHQTRGFFPATPAQASQVDRSVVWVDGVPTAAFQVSIAAGERDGVAMVGLAAASGGVCHTLRVGPRGVAGVESRGMFETTQRNCDGAAALLVDEEQW
jgi:type II secretory pathway pseudopilin PulG